MLDELICSPRVAALLFQQIGALSSLRINTDYLHKLTRREHEVLTLIAEGLSNKQIAQRLDITLSTTKNHVHNLLNKLQVHRRSEVMAISNVFGAFSLQSVAE
jgi:two-component system, NarL family, nitrate/nitrite response regulator NarL